jgi:GT2 family glycosyltransferase
MEYRLPDNQSGTPHLSIVVLNWNVAGLLAACLRSLPAACGDWWPRTEVIVVDNASTDDSLALLREEFPDVRVIALPENVGFSAGNNTGILPADPISCCSTRTPSAS